MQFNYNLGLAKQGGALSLNDNSDIIDQNGTVTFDDNTVEYYGGAVYLMHLSNGLFTGRSLVAFLNNAASKHGGAVYIHNSCNAKVTFCNNNLLFEENSRVIFNSNRATLTGGAISSKTISKDSLEENIHKSANDINNQILI